MSDATNLKTYTTEELFYQDLNDQNDEFVARINERYETADMVSANTANKGVKRDASGNFSAGTITADLVGNADTATLADTATTGPGASLGFLYLLNAGVMAGQPLSRKNSDLDIDTWLSVGPTGSGADIEWPALDDIPTDAKAVYLSLSASADHREAAVGEVSVGCMLRKDDTVTPSAQVVFAEARTQDAVNYNNVIAVVSLEDRTFQLYWTKQLVGSLDTMFLDIYLEGYFL
jgi:hypothetical protein